MWENTRYLDPVDRRWRWWHRWKNGDASIIPGYVSKYTVWRPKQQRARDGTVVRHKTGGLKKIA